MDRRGNETYRRATRILQLRRLGWPRRAPPGTPRAPHPPQRPFAGEKLPSFGLTVQLNMRMRSQSNFPGREVNRVRLTWCDTLPEMEEHRSAPDDDS